MYNEDQCADKCETPEGEPEVSREFVELQQAIQSLKEKISSLSGRLSPILREENLTQESCEKESSCETSIGREIRKNRDEICVLKSMVSNIIERLGV